MKNAVLTAALMLSALGAGAQNMQMLGGGDPLSKEILAKTAQENGGVTAAVRVAGSNQGIALKLVDLSAVPAAQLAAPAASPVLTATPADGLVVRAKPAPKKTVRRAIHQLKRVAANKGLGEKI